MRVTLRREREMIDHSKSLPERMVKVKPGDYEVERIPNPNHGTGPEWSILKADWLIIRGTTIGMCESSWRQYQDGQIITDSRHPRFGQIVDWGDQGIAFQE